MILPLAVSFVISEVREEIKSSTFSLKRKQNQHSFPLITKVIHIQGPEKHNKKIILSVKENYCYSCLSFGVYLSRPSIRSIEGEGKYLGFFFFGSWFIFVFC